MKCLRLTDLQINKDYLQYKYKVQRDLNDN